MERLYKYILKPIIKIYLKTEPTVRLDGFKIKVFKTVFHPTLFFSTTYFYDFLKRKELKQKMFLEIGCGSGAITMLAHRKHAIVSCCDINPVALANTKYNISNNAFDNKNAVTYFESDVLLNIPLQQFDAIAINPPYYFKDANVDEQFAWNCGVNGEYFEKLFSQLKNYMHTETQVLMILAEVCDIERIKSIAAKNSLEMRVVDKRKIKWETSFIFKIDKSLASVN
jgi:release factor glutamine methyltransferase